MLYKLDSIDAYEQKLVKQIEVAGIEVKDAHNRAYLKLLSVNNAKQPITAKIEIDYQMKMVPLIERRLRYRVALI